MDDDRNESRDRGIGNHRQESNGENGPELGVKQEFPDLSDFEMSVANTRVVGFESRNQDISLSLAKALGADGIGREDEDEDNAPDDGESTREVVHVSPGGYSSVDLTESVVDDRGDDRDVAGARVPDTHAHGLFVLLVETSLKRLSKESTGMRQTDLRLSS